MKSLNENMVHVTKGNLEYLQFVEFNNTGLVKHCITTRHGGVSEGQFGQLNLSVNTQDNKENVTENRKIICNKLAFNYDNMVTSSQVHGDNIEIVDENSKNLTDVDGLITNRPNVPLMTFYADCVPILFLDPVKKVIASSHSGWRGTVKKIAQKTVIKMKEIFNCRPADILVGIGPSIGPCCFETQKPVADEFDKVFGDRELYEEKKQGYYIDLWKANRIQLEEVGVQDRNIFLSQICTKCNTKDFYSHRAENGKTGRFSAIIQLL